jgi:excisionase family DNA binding protein
VPARRRLGFTGAAGETAPLFVRIPAAEAEKLDRAAFALRRPKQQLVGALVARYVDPGSPEGLDALRALTVERDELAVGHASFRAAEQPEVLTPAQAAELLQVDEKTVRTLATRGELPGRKLGRHWRFSRRALLDWLAAAAE